MEHGSRILPPAGVLRQGHRLPQTAGEQTGSSRSPQPVPEGNPAQWRAISYTGRYCLILAGPGSGKTFVLTRHIHYLVDQCQADPGEILVLTFSRAAARQMQSRYQKLPAASGAGHNTAECSSGSGRPVVFGTFHSVFYHILRSIAGEDLHLIDAASRSRLLQTLCRQYVSNTFDERDMQKMEREISRRKVHASDIPAADTDRNAAGSPDPSPDYRAAYDYYAAYLNDNHLIDFDDMILQCGEALRAHPEQLRHWQERFRYILIDEFQDISPQQYEIIRLLHRPGNALFCVGDDDQAIYGFRGADPGIMKRFQSDYPKVTTIPLKINYRSGRNIIRAAERVIGENTQRIRKHQNASSGEETTVRIDSYAGEEEEYHQICTILTAMDAAALSRTAIICRTHAGEAGLVYVMKQYGILYDGKQIRQSAAQRAGIIRDLQAYLRMAVGLRELGVIRRADYYQVMNKPVRFLNRRSADREQMTPADFLRQTVPGSCLYLTYSDLFRDLAVIGKLRPFLAMQYLLTSVGYQEYALREAGAVHAEETRMILAGLLEQSRSAPDLRTWISVLAGDGSFSGKPVLAHTDQSTISHQGVHLMTMHASKGLEYDTVILPDLNEGILPSRKSDTPEGIEEERRLLYVAMTRARRSLYLMYIRGSAINPRRPSRFLSVLGVKTWAGELSSDMITRK